MRAIRKLAEPQSLAQYRAGVDVSYQGAYDDYPHKADVRVQLVNEQRALCAFCGCRIVADPLKMKIAHWKPRKLNAMDALGQEAYPNLSDQLSYWNMLGCCNGNEGQPPEKQHCDTHQGNLPLSRNPANADHRIEDFVSFPRMFWDPNDEMKRRFFSEVREHLLSDGRVYFGWADFADLNPALPLAWARDAGLRYLRHYSALAPSGSQTFYVIVFGRSTELKSAGIGS